MSEENEFEWNPNEGDIDMSKELISIHNSKFKNNEPLEQYKYQDYMLKNVDLHEVDVTGYFLNDDCTNSTAPLSDDSLVESYVPNLDNDTCNNSINLETVLTDSTSTGNAPNTHENPHIDTVDDTVPTDIECHNNIEDEDFDVYYQVPVPKNGNPRDLSLTPITIAVMDTIGLIKSRKLLRVLLDPGSSGTMIHERIVPKKAVPMSLSRNKAVKTIAGTMNTNRMVHLRDIRLPEFDKNRKISHQKALIFNKDCRYDIIFGADFLTKINLDVRYSTKSMEWYGNSVKMREPWDLNNQEFLHMADSFFLQVEDDMFGDDWLDSYATERILDAKYEKLDLDGLMSKQDHLNADQKEQLKSIFLKCMCVLGLQPSGYPL